MEYINTERRVEDVNRELTLFTRRGFFTKREITTTTTMVVRTKTTFNKKKKKTRRNGIVVDDSDTATPRLGVTVKAAAAPCSALDPCGCSQRALLTTRRWCVQIRDRHRARTGLRRRPRRYWIRQHTRPGAHRLQDRRRARPC